MVASRGIERVIVDITGVVSVDSSSVAFVRRLVDAVALLGAKPIVTGIRSDLARMLATSDENLSGITIKHSLADGLAVWRARGSNPMKKVFRT
jgi:rsbT co-antagonist protein RsbR